MKNPYRTDREIERLADETRKNAYKAGVECEFPFHAENTVEFLFNYRLKLGEEMPIGTLGYTDFENRIVGISNNSYNDGSHRFTVAHEIGHIVMHAEVVQAEQKLKSLFDRPLGPVQNQQMETQANKFAAALLMPAAEMILRFEPLLERNGYVDARDVAQMFGVSVQSAELRLGVLNLVVPRNQRELFGWND